MTIHKPFFSKFGVKDMDRDNLKILLAAVTSLIIFGLALYFRSGIFQ